jgi:hypothetical protein
VRAVLVALGKDNLVYQVSHTILSAAGPFYPVIYTENLDFANYGVFIKHLNISSTAQFKFELKINDVTMFTLFNSKECPSIQTDIGIPVDRGSKLTYFVTNIGKHSADCYVSLTYRYIDLQAEFEHQIDEELGVMLDRQ